MLETWKYSPFEDCLSIEDIFWGWLFSLGQEAVIHALDYDQKRIATIYTRYGYEIPAEELIEQVRKENLSPYNSLIPVVE